MTILYGMAVLIVRFTFILLAYMVFRDLNWHQFFTERNYHRAQYASILLSIAVGHITGSFIMTIIETLQALFVSSFYNIM